jgi:hypothetical protein
MQCVMTRIQIQMGARAIVHKLCTILHKQNENFELFLPLKTGTQILVRANLPLLEGGVISRGRCEMEEQMIQYAGSHHLK